MKPADDLEADPLREQLTSAIGFQYRVERMLGRGGMGAVYLAHELALDRDVAIKVLPPEQAHASQVRERFRREARTAARLNHPNIVPLHTFGEVSGLTYFVMGYVAGESLAARLRRQGALAAEDARTLLAAMCDALVYAHRQGVVHRDIKPDNILIDAETGAPLLTDFGIAKPALAEAQITTTGQLIGTPHYMSPEQALGKGDVDARSDLYSLGVVGYEIVTGRRPFEADSPLDALSQRLTRDPKPIGSIAPDTPSDLAAAIHRCLLRTPAERWRDAAALREALAPSEEEAEYAPPVRILQMICTIALPLAAVAAIHLEIFATLNPEVGFAERPASVLGGMVTALVVVAVAMFARLRALGVDSRSIVRKALQQPDWSRSWYPRTLRRRGDVWDRLPVSLRRFRLAKGMLLGYAFTVFLPLQLLAPWEHQPAWLRAGLWTIGIAGFALSFALRGRAVAGMQARSRTSDIEAETILNTPTWRTSVWRRPANASILTTPAPTAPGASPFAGSTPSATPADATPVPTAAGDLSPTRISERIGGRPTQAG